ncbi:aldo keto reductase [Colletotrichum tofieldiae]|nr:aldo keto reductase [Colletotrichum tofieldiae]
MDNTGHNRGYADFGTVCEGVSSRGRLASNNLNVNSRPIVTHDRPFIDFAQRRQYLTGVNPLRHFGVVLCLPPPRARSPSHLRSADPVQPLVSQIEGSVGAHLLQTCRELSVTAFGYSPLGRSVMTGQYKFAGDFWRQLSRFQGEEFAKNIRLVEKFREMAS